MYHLIKNPFERKQKGAVTILCIICILLIWSCQTKNSDDETEKFCSYINEENIDETIPMVNEFLSGLPSSLDMEQQMQVLQDLAAWLKSHPCILDATFVGGVGACSINNTSMSEILVSFDENGIKKELILDVLHPNPLKAIGYHVHHDKYSSDRMHSVQLKEITEDSLIYVVYSTIAGGAQLDSVEYEEYDKNTIKANIFYSQEGPIPTCIFLKLATVSIKKDTYQKAVISTFLKRSCIEDDDYLPIDSREMNLKSINK